MTSILDTLKQEHEALRQLFARINATADSEADARKDLLKQIEDALIPHAKWEETVFYPAFAERATYDEKLLYAEAIQEHRAVEKAVLPDIHASDFDSRQFAGSVKVLSQMIEHHAREEETAMFAAARQLFSASELAEFDAKYAEWKKSSAAAAIGGFAKVKTAVKGAMHSPQAPG